MVDVGAKQETERVARAGGTVHMSREAFELIKSGSVKKGDVLGVARIAGIMAAKKVDSLIPLTHPLMITRVTVDFELNNTESTIDITAVVAICLVTSTGCGDDGETTNDTDASGDSKGRIPPRAGSRAPATAPRQPVSTPRCP